MVQINEVIVFIIILLGFIPLIISLKKEKGTSYFFLAYFFLLLGAIFTIVEDFVYHTEMNYAEHFIGVMLTGIFFLIWSYINYRKINMIKEALEKKIRGGK